MKPKRTRATKNHGKYRSKLEARLVPALEAMGAEYEPVRLPFTPSKPKTYTPDVRLPNGVLLELKGWFTPADRTKMLDVKRAYPELDIRLVLERPQTKLNPKSKTTLAAWADKHGFLWADNHVPAAWLQ